jgi:hypothetical protein
VKPFVTRPIHQLTGFARSIFLLEVSRVLRLEVSRSCCKALEMIPASKCNKIRAAWAIGDRVGALRIAARFFDRSEATKAFKRGMDARNNPGFYLQLGKDPDLLLSAALQLLARKFSL